MSDRIKENWTNTVIQAFGATPQVQDSVDAEKLYYEWAKNRYDEVNWYADNRIKQNAGIDFEIKMKTWKRPYCVDVKNNFKNGTFIIDIKLIVDKRKLTDRYVHIDLDKKCVIDYDKELMLEHLIKCISHSEFKPNLLRLDSSAECLKDILKFYRLN